VECFENLSAPPKRDLLDRWKPMPRPSFEASITFPRVRRLSGFVIFSADDQQLSAAVLGIGLQAHVVIAVECMPVQGVAECASWNSCRNDVGPVRIQFRVHLVTIVDRRIRCNNHRPRPNFAALLRADGRDCTAAELDGWRSGKEVNTASSGPFD